MDILLEGLTPSLSLLPPLPPLSQPSISYALEPTAPYPLTLSSAVSTRYGGLRRIVLPSIPLLLFPRSVSLLTLSAASKPPRFLQPLYPLTRGRRR